MNEPPEQYDREDADMEDPKWADFMDPHSNQWDAAQCKSCLLYNNLCFVRYSILYANHT